MTNLIVALVGFEPDVHVDVGLEATRLVEHPAAVRTLELLLGVLVDPAVRVERVHSEVLLAAAVLHTSKEIQ